MFLRVVSFNVQRFKKGGIGPVANALRDLSPTIVALQEVTSSGFDDLAAELSEYHAEFFGHVSGRFGNAVLSAHPMSVASCVHLRGGSEVSLPAGTRTWRGTVTREGERYRIVRGLLVCEVSLPNGHNLIVSATHLDHMSLAERIVQMEHCLEELPDGGATPVLLLGDFNTLRRADYTAAEWTALCDRAKAKGWRPPEDGGLDVLEAAEYTDMCAMAADTSVLRTAPTDNPCYRVDHCVASRGFVATWQPVAARVAAHVDCSDHLPLVVDFAVRAEDKADGGHRGASSKPSL
eukprot:m.173289 g.173289  ORF g.173289 m.173289 type:complete len:292 (-) comp13674_c0_seq1:151-1026(-)